MRYQLRYPIEAIQYTGDTENKQQLIYFFRNMPKHIKILGSRATGADCISVKTADEGWVFITPGYWVHRNLKGDIFVLEHEQFTDQFKQMEG